MDTKNLKINQDFLKPYHALIDYVCNYAGFKKTVIRQEIAKILKVSVATVDNFGKSRELSLDESKKISIMLVGIVCSDSDVRAKIDKVVLRRLVIAYFINFTDTIEAAEIETDDVFAKYMLRV